MNKTINDNEKDVTCRICYEQCTRVYGAHLKKHGLTSKEYKERFPDAPLMALKDKKNTTKNSGKHMKTEKYKKMFSEKFKGDKNPMHSSKRTEQQRKENSPFSKEYYKKRYPKMTDKQIEKEISKFTKESAEGRLLPLHVKYWTKKGYTKEEARKKVSERQTTFSKKICIDKYGEEKGLKVWKKRQEKWTTTLDNKTDEEKKEINRKKIENCSFVSKISQELFWKIHETLELNEHIYFNDKNKEYYLYDKKNKKYYLYDYIDKKNKKCIEFNGWFWHCKPSLYKENYYNKVKKKTAKEIWKEDEIKHDLLTKKGYDILVIWEDDYRKNKEKIIEKCIKFLLKN